MRQGAQKLGARQERPGGDALGVPGLVVPRQPHLAQNLAFDVPLGESRQVVIAHELRDRGRARRGRARYEVAFGFEQPHETEACIRPTDLTRIQMWTCLLHSCFQKVEGFRSAWEAGLVTVDRWEKARQEVTAERQFTPHPVWVAERVLVLLEATSSAIKV